MATDSMPMEIGTELAQARMRRVLSLSDLSSRTKASVETLRAIERNEWQRLPGGIYTRGLLRAVAREVGCDADAIVAEYRARFETPAPPSNEPIVRAGANSQAIHGGHVNVADLDSLERRRS